MNKINLWNVPEFLTIALIVLMCLLGLVYVMIQLKTKSECPSSNSQQILLDAIEKNQKEIEHNLHEIKRAIHLINNEGIILLDELKKPKIKNSKKKTAK